MAIASDSSFAPEGGAHHRARRAVEGYIECLIALLDEIDEDSDLEDTDDAEPDSDGEPSLGWPTSFGRRQQLSLEGLRVQSEDGEAEDDHDAEAVNEDGGETGPSDNGLGDMGGASEAWFGQDGDGEFAGGDRRALGEPECYPEAWGRA